MEALTISKLRTGYTSGTCAQAAAKACAIMLASGNIVEEVSLTTASGAQLNIKISNQEIGGDFARCAVTKDSGDDPDITNGLEFFVEVRLSARKGIILKGGKGVGKITKPGLAVAAGEWAINPVPRKMIINELKKWPDLFLPGIEVTISVPRGEETAKRTFNPRLGIEGGISILGTTGIVEPKSLEAYKTSLALQLDVLKASGATLAALVAGYVGDKFCKEVLGLKHDTIVKTGDHIGFMFEECAKKGMTQIIFAGHIGKLVKIANGQFNTHCQYGDGRIDTIVRYAKAAKACKAVIDELFLQEAAESAAQVLKKNNLNTVFDMLAKAAVEKLNKLVNSALKINCYILSLQGELLGSCNEFSCERVKTGPV